MISSSGRYVVMPPSTSGFRRLRSRTLAKVPRIMTSWLPRRAPYELKSLGGTPFDRRYLPAGLSAGMDPAGEIWSVVTESPSIASTSVTRPMAGRSVDAGLIDTAARVTRCATPSSSSATAATSGRSRAPVQSSLMRNVSTTAPSRSGSSIGIGCESSIET